MWAAEKGKVNAAKILLKYGDVDIYIQNKDCMTALHWAAKSGNLEVVELLSRESCDV